MLSCCLPPSACSTDMPEVLHQSMVQDQTVKGRQLPAGGSCEAVLSLLHKYAAVHGCPAASRG